MEDRDKRKEQDGSIFTADGKAVPAEGVEGMMIDYVIVSVIQTNIIDLFEHNNN